MTAKRKKRKRSASKATSSTKVEATKVEEKRERKEAAGRAAPAESPYPAMGVSLAAGFRAVGSSPAVVVTAFLGLLATWGAFVALGSDVGPRTLSLLLSPPPVHIFGDAPVALSAEASVVTSVLSVAGLAALRGVTFGLLLTFITQVLTDGRTALRPALERLPRIAIVVGGLYLVEFGLVVAAFQLLVGFLGQLAILAIAAALYFLVFAPIVAAADGEGPRGSLRRGYRATRLPGTRHLTMVMAYFLILIYSGAIAPFPPLTPVTPTVGIWAYGLLFTFVHVGVLAGFAYRWLAVRDRVPAASADPGA